MLLRLFVSFAVLGLAFCTVTLVPAAKLAASPYHRWAHEHWVWNHNSLSNQGNVTQLIDDYAKYNIKVGGVNIDSTWATQYNSFVPVPEKFPNFQDLVGYIHSKGQRVILWTTSFVNTENPDFAMAVSKKYLVRDKNGDVRPLSWWHGEGGLLDYSNPEARDWWHGLLDNVLVLPNGDGVDGFKCDSSDPYILEYLEGPDAKALGYNDVPYESYHQYADYYYGDFFNHTRARRGDAGLIMSRPVDCVFRDQVTRVCLQQSPKYVMTSGWVGDDNSDMHGLRGCAKKVIWSAWDGYANFACDIGGYRSQQLTQAETKFYFLRSAQFNAFLPLMENGGSGEHRPWMVVPGDSEITDLYRDLVNQHTRLSQYFLSLGTKALAAGTSTITPLAVNSEDPERPRSHRIYSIPSTYSYLLGTDVLVHPPLFAAAEGKKEVDVSAVEMRFPGDAATAWLDWWHPTLAHLSHTGGTKSLRIVPLREYPVYVRAGALLPLWEDGVGSLAQPHTTFTWFAPDAKRDTAPVIADVHEPVAAGAGMTATASFLAATTIELRVSAHEGPVAISLVNVSKPSNVGVLGAICLEHVYNPLTKTLDVKCPNNNLGTVFTIQF